MRFRSKGVRGRAESCPWVGSWTSTGFERWVGLGRYRWAKLEAEGWSTGRSSQTPPPQSGLVDPAQADSEYPIP